MHVNSESVIQFDKISINLDKRSVKIDDKPMHLQPQLRTTLKQYVENNM
jgi:hypothetical protein